jgi:stage V sporulation protein D (sporulation-specific penicillin-binding protein)
MKHKEKRRLSARAVAVFWLFTVLSACLIVRLFNVQVRDGRALAAQAGDEQRATFALSGRRGDIVDRADVPFALSMPSFAVFVQPAAAAGNRAQVRKLAALLGRSQADVTRALNRHAPFTYLARNVSETTAKRLHQLGLPGVGIEEEPLGVRVEPQSRIGSTVIGFTGVDNQGLAGIEYSFNGVLRGEPGKLVEQTDNAGRPLPFGHLSSKPPRVGNAVVLTLDHVLEYDAENILHETVARYGAQGGSIIVMRAQTGEILALANAPNFDPNHYASAPQAAWRDRAVTDPYEPGSTFKLVTAAAALDSGKVSVYDAFPAIDAIEVGHRTIHNADDGLMASGHSAETLADIIAYSHNVGAAQVALRIGKRTMFDYIKRFALDAPTAIDLPGESGGIIDDPQDWWGSRLATIGFGQGISVTPLALARAYAAIANGGLLMRPLIVRSVETPSGRLSGSFAPHVVRRVMRRQTAAALLAMLRDVVKRGTARAAAIPGYDIAGKTGTAQMVVDGAYQPGAYTASFIGIVPADKPQYVILVKIDRPRGAYYGSIVALPAFKQLALRVFWREGILPHHLPATIQAQGNGRRPR